MLADQMLGAGVAGELGHLGEEAARPQHGIAALAADGRHADRAALDGTERRHQAVEQRRADARHVAELHDRGVDILAERADAGAHRGAEALGEIRIGHEAQARLGRHGLLDGGAAPRPPCGPARPRPRRPARRAPPSRHARPAAGRRRRPASCSGRPCGSSGRRPAPARRRAAPAAVLASSPSLSSRGCGRLGDLGQKAAGAHAHDLGAADRQAGGQPLQHHVEAVVLGRLGAARQAEHRLAVELGRSAAGCRDRPACRNG